MNVSGTMMKRISNRTLVVENLPRYTEAEQGEEEVKRLFYAYGPITDIDLKMIPSKSSVYAFVEFEDPNDTERAIYGRNGHVLHGNELLVKLHPTRSLPIDFCSSYKSVGGRDGVSKQSDYRVLVTGLPPSASEQELEVKEYVSRRHSRSRSGRHSRCHSRSRNRSTASRGMSAHHSFSRSRSRYESLGSSSCYVSLSKMRDRPTERRIEEITGTRPCAVPETLGDHSDHRDQMLAMLSNWTSFLKVRETVESYIHEVGFLSLEHERSRQFLQEELDILEKLSSKLAKEEKAVDAHFVLVSHKLLRAMKAIMKIHGIKKFIKYDTEILNYDLREWLGKFTESRRKRKRCVKVLRQQKRELESKMDSKAILWIFDEKVKEARELERPMERDECFRIFRSTCSFH